MIKNTKHPAEKKFFPLSRKNNSFSELVTANFANLIDISRYIDISRDISRYIAIYCLSGQNVSYNHAFLMAIYNMVPVGLWSIWSAEFFFKGHWPRIDKI